ncbi:FecR domain-containing protein [Pseudomonas sp. UL073]|uniref:FecR domain-containing protein n=1 Tax=Zestomonas insulae TaxID=2809017 RepID=A0ABS2IB76_9GAMM|nr:FecR domain-containing protein [Pseudomonas insulae]MBM7060030.1 FecR domain-containing protein [Pseudomonas insulae]
MSRPADAVLEQAAEWLVRLEAEPQCRREFDNWQRSDPRHAAAIASLQGVLARFQSLPAAPTHSALGAAHRLERRRSVKRSAGSALLALALAVPLALFLRSNPPSYLLADLRTASGEWHSTQLEDGSRISLMGHSAVDLRFVARQRTLHLEQGGILVDVAADAGRPFVVQTEHGSIRALGTRFVVEKRDQATWLTMLESKVEVRSATDGRTTQVVAGQRLRLDARGFGTPESIDAGAFEQAWRQHQLVVQDRPLPEVLALLAEQHAGHLSYDADALGGLRVSAVLPLDEPDRALRLLSRSFPIRLQQFTPWLVRVAPASAAK